MSAASVAALDAAINEALTSEYGDENWSELGSLCRISRAILASDWLAAHDAEVRRDTAERIAQGIEERATDLPPGAFRAVQFDELRHAARIAREATS